MKYELISLQSNLIRLHNKANDIIKDIVLVQTKIQKLIEDNDKNTSKSKKG